MPRFSWLCATVLVLARIPAIVFAETIPDQFVFGASGVSVKGPLPGGIYTRQLLLTSAAGEIAVNRLNSGYRDSLGNGDFVITNAGSMLTGWCNTLCFREGIEFRGWIDFRVPEGGPYTSASLRLAEWWVAAYPGNTETVSFHDVETPVSVLFSEPPNVAIFDDLGNGVLYGTQDFPAFLISPPDYGSPVFTIPLNGAALAAINNARGDFFTMGTRLDTLDLPAPEPNELPVLAAALAICIGFRFRASRGLTGRETYRT